MLAVTKLGSSLRLGFALGIAALMYWTPLASAFTNYGEGLYGACTYNECGITIVSSGTVSLDITPTSALTCTVEKDTVGVTTDSSTGYSLTISDTDDDNSMTGTNGGTVQGTTGTYASPASLVANRWGYRVDGRGSFGAGPTSAYANGAAPSGSFAATPADSGAADTIASTSAPANPTVNTSVWFGMCASNDLPSGSFSDDVIYTAIVN